MLSQEVNNNMNPISLELEDRLLASQLVSEVCKSPGHVSFTMTDRGMMALIDAIRMMVSENLVTERREGSKSVFPDKNDDFVSKKEVMAGYGISHTTLWKWEKTGYLLPVKVGKKVFYRREDLRKLSSKDNI